MHKIVLCCLVLLGVALTACSADATPTLAPVVPTATVGITTPAALPTPIPLHNPAQFGKTSVTAALTGSGSSLAQPLYARWFEQYKTLAPGVSFSYNANGSGAGRNEFMTLVTDFGASDAAMKDAELQAAQGGATLHIPTAIGAVVVTYNLPGATATSLNLSSDVLSGIFLGTIKNWNDPAIIADNAGVMLPNLPIKLVVRADSSGTTEIFTRYLSVVSPMFRDTVGPGGQPTWEKTGSTYLKGDQNDGVVAQIQQNAGAIGYTELAYARSKNLPVASIRNQAGRFVAPSVESTQAAVAGTQIPDDFRIFVVNADGENAYPIAGFTWLLVYVDQAKGRQPSPTKAAALANFLWWAIHDGQKTNADLLYAPLPATLLPRLEQNLLKLTYNGQPLLK